VFTLDSEQVMTTTKPTKSTKQFDTCNVCCENFTEKEENALVVWRATTRRAMSVTRRSLQARG